MANPLAQYDEGAGGDNESWWSKQVYADRDGATLSSRVPVTEWRMACAVVWLWRPEMMKRKDFNSGLGHNHSRIIGENLSQCIRAQHLSKTGFLTTFRDQWAGTESEVEIKMHIIREV